MGKETDLWDDSALVNAFDQALAKYKVMHSNISHDDTTEGMKSTNNENGFSVTKMIHENVEPHDKMNNTVEAVTETSMPCSNNERAHEVSKTQESQPVAGTHFPESNPELTGATSTHGHLNIYEGTEYARLLSEYYEIEEKRQKILQQLQQVGYWNDPSSTQYQTPHVHQGSNTSHLGHLPLCCLSHGHCCLCSTASSSNCDSCCPWDAYKSSSQTHQIPAVKTAAESVASSLKFEASATSNVYQEEKHKGREETSGVGGGQRSQDVIDSESDLAIVINAWYSAGFYTGRQGIPFRAVNEKGFSLISSVDDTPQLCGHCGKAMDGYGVLSNGLARRNVNLVHAMQKIKFPSGSLLSYKFTFLSSWSTGSSKYR